MSIIVSSSTEFSTEWFDLVARRVQGAEADAPYYCLEMKDYVSVLALTKNGEVLLVRQYRPAVEAYTLELPAGHVEHGETPEEAAKRELLEETGYEAIACEPMGCLFPDTGRLANRMWCYFVPNAERKGHPEEGIELVSLHLDDLCEKITSGEFLHALHVAVLGQAFLRRLIVPSLSSSS